MTNRNLVIVLLGIAHVLGFFCGYGFGRASVPKQVNIVTYNLTPKAMPPAVYLPLPARPPHGGVQTPISVQMPVNAKETASKEPL
jgi:hypothetical protein